MCPRTMLWASLVLLLSAPAHAHLIRIPTGLPDILPAPLDLDGGVLSAVNGTGAPLTEFQNFLGDFVWGPRGARGQSAQITLEFDRPVTSVNAWVGSISRGLVNVELWSGPYRLTHDELDMNFPGGSTFPYPILITPPEPATKLVITGLGEITFWRADVVWAVPEPSGVAMLAIGLLIPAVCGFRRRCPPAKTP